VTGFFVYPGNLKGEVSLAYVERRREGRMKLWLLL